MVKKVKQLYFLLLKINCFLKKLYFSRLKRVFLKIIILLFRAPMQNNINIIEQNNIMNIKMLKVIILIYKYNI